MNNLYKIINTFKHISLEHSLVNRFTEGDVYTNLNEDKEKKYPVINLDIDNITVGDNFQTVTGNLFYIDRLLDDESNRVEVQSVAMRTLQSLLNKISETYAWNWTSQTYTPFTEKFADLCAGAYVSFSIQVPTEEICADDAFTPAVITITENGTYDVAAYDTAIVNDPDAVLGKTLRENNDYKTRYEEIVPTLNTKYPDIVGWLYTQIALSSTNRAYEVLQGADAYYIVDDDVYAYENGDEDNPITYVDADGNETTGSRNYIFSDVNATYEILYGYVMGTQANGVRDNYNYIYCHYCNDAIIPIVRYTGNNRVYGFVDLNFKEGYTDVTIAFGQNYPIFFATNATSLNNSEVSYICNHNNALMAGVSFDNLETLQLNGLLYNVWGINSLTLPSLKHIGSSDKTSNGGAVASNCPNIKTLYLPSLESIELTLLYYGALADNCKNLKKISCPLLTTVTASGTGDRQMLAGRCTNLEEVDFPELVDITVSSTYGAVFQSCTNLSVINMPKLEKITDGGGGPYMAFLNGSSAIEELNLPSLKEYNMSYRAYLTLGCSNLKRIYLPALEVSPQQTSWWTLQTVADCPNIEYVYLGCKGETTDKIGFGVTGDSTNLTDIEIGEGARQSIGFWGIDNLTRDNIVNHIFNRLADNTDGSPIRITLGSTNLARLSDEDKEIATNKNYTLA